MRTRTRPSSSRAVARAPGAPAVSLVVGVCDDPDVAEEMLRALALTMPPGVAYETHVLHDEGSGVPAGAVGALEGEVHLVPFPRGEGWARALNDTVRAARAPVVGLVDRDTVVQPGWLEPLLERLGHDRRIGAIQPRVVSPDGALWSDGGVFAADGRPLLAGLGLPRFPADRPILEGPDFVDGSCVVLQRDAFVGVGGIDTAYPDGVAQFADLSRALARAKWRVASEHRATVLRRSPPELRAGSGRVVAKWGPPPRRRFVRSIAFYSPRFHPTPETDRLLGPGTTDWHAVVSARPRFPGHLQPNLPADLGFYDLRLEAAREAQAELANGAGIGAFCYLHHWSLGRRLFREPLDAVLASGHPDFPFCVCWVNEDWPPPAPASLHPGAAAGPSGEPFVAQGYSAEDDRAHLVWLAQCLADPRYVRIEGKALLLVLRASRLPDPRRTAGIWRREARRLRLGELLLCRVESSPDEHGDPREIGFDASVELPPDLHLLGGRTAGTEGAQGAGPVVPYAEVIGASLGRGRASWRRIPTVVPGWDETPADEHGLVLEGSTPGLFAAWTSALCADELRREVEPVVFVNAWNRWTSGAHLEPSRRLGTELLDAHRDAVRAPLRRLRRRTPVLCVAGMHATGLSLVAAWLERCGLPFGGGDATPAEAPLALRSMEDPAFVDRAIRAIARRWGGSQGWFVTDQVPAHLEGVERQSAQHLVAERNRRFDQWGWKDPRATLLLESWSELVEDLAVLLVWRPARLVVGSLLRGGAHHASAPTPVDALGALRVWLAYNRQAIAYRLLYPDATCLVSVEAVVDEPEEVRSLLGERLGLELTYTPFAAVYDPTRLTFDGPRAPAARGSRRLSHRRAQDGEADPAAEAGWEEAVDAALGAAEETWGWRAELERVERELSELSDL